VSEGVGSLIFGTPDKLINQAVFDQVYAQAVAA